MTVSRSDILVENHGSIVLLSPATTAGREWLEANCDPSGYGEGTRLLGFRTVSTNADGHASFTGRFPAVANGVSVTAIATGAEGSSEFSPCVPVTGRSRPAPPAPLPV